MPTKSIFDILEKEHDKTRELFKQTESKNADHGNVFSRIRTELTIHMDGGVLPLLIATVTGYAALRAYSINSKE